MTAAPLARSEHQGVHRLVMTDGPNALSPALMEALTDALSELRGSGAPPVLLASSHPSVFCPGWDLKRLVHADRAEVEGFLDRFNRLVRELFCYPGPTGAAITGHAVAGGCLLTMCCDVRIMASGRPRIGMSELNIGVPVPAVSLAMLRARLTEGVVEELVVRGDGMTAERARAMGIVLRSVEPDRVVAAVERELNRIGSRPTLAFAATKRFLLADSWARVAHPDPDADRIFLDCWFSDETRSRLVDLVERISR
jgi:enoyl-CoA hydratase/carnithine racemase